MKRSLLIITATLSLLLAGCAAEPTAFDTAWTACVESSTRAYPEGIVNADTGRTVLPDEICHSTIAAQGKDWFTEFYNDPERVKVYEDAITK